MPDLRISTEGPRPPRRKGPGIDLTRIPPGWVAGGLLILAAVVLAVWILTMPSGEQPPATPTAAPPSPTAAGSAAPAPQVQVGVIVKVAGTEGEDLRLRAEPSLNAATLRLVEEGAVLQVVEGPVRADGYVWWKVRDQQGRTGWAAGDWLAPQGAAP